jgi:hypothetical protein
MRALLARIGLVLLSLIDPVRRSTGVPLLSVFMAFPWTWAVLFAVVLVEAFMARRILGVTPGRALTISAAANLISTLLALPIALPVIVPNLSTLPFVVALFLIPAFFVSVFAQRFVAYCFVPRDQRDAVRRWSWQANIRSYEGLLLLLLAAGLLDRLT